MSCLLGWEWDGGTDADGRQGRKMERKEGEGWGLLFSAFPLMSVVQYVHTTAAGVSPSWWGWGTRPTGKRRVGGLEVPSLLLLLQRRELIKEYLSERLTLFELFARRVQVCAAVGLLPLLILEPNGQKIEKV